MSALPADDEAIDRALVLLDRVASEDTDTAIEDVADAMRRLIRLRDNLIARFRENSGESSGAADDRERLARTNAIISNLVGAEFPIAGFHRERVTEARDALREMLARQ